MRLVLLLAVALPAFAQEQVPTVTSVHRLMPGSCPRFA